MSETLLPLAAFHLTGERSGTELDDVGRLGLRPALFSAYQALPKLRYDYPVVFVNGSSGGEFVRSLSGIIDGILQEIAPRGVEGERVRKRVLGLEREIRTLASRGSKGTLSQLWELAETELVSRADDAARESFDDSLGRARSALPVDGEVTDCDEELPVKLLTHAWTAVQEDKARRFRDRVDELILKLANILKADFMASEEAQSAETLKRSVGPEYEGVFDFEAMSRILRTASGNGALPEARRRRVASAVSVLKSQRFFTPAVGEAEKRPREETHCFVFDRCAPALEAFQQRLPEMVELVKAMTVAQLEVENRYNESTHDPFFRRFDERFPGPEDLALFPSYLICLRDGVGAAAEKAKLIEVLSSGLPIKVLVQSDDILEDPSLGSGLLSLGIKGLQVAAMALGLNNAYVLRASGACLYQLRDAILRGLANHGPALFSVYSGLAGNSRGTARNAPRLPPYLSAAAATESRAFPAFTYDPASGSDWASRFSIGGNPQVEAEWPIHCFSYEDEDLQRVSEDIAFTFVDFVACDGRYAGCFAGVPGSKRHDNMVPVNEFLELDAGDAAEKIPYVLMIDESNTLHRAVVEERLIDAARRCRQMWRNLQELGGINNSHAKRLLAREREVWEREKERELAALTGRPGPEAETPAPLAAEAGAAALQEAAPAAVAEAAEAPSDEPYIETPRCTTCNECTEINNKMFAYDDNMQAYIADADAGTYRQLVEAAELCQVCVIHPGKPKNPNEPNLDELIERAEPFM